MLRAQEVEEAHRVAQVPAFSSPYMALSSLLRVLNDPNRDETQLAPLFAHPGYDTPGRVRIAQKLKQVLDGTGEVIYLEEVPQNHSYRDSISGFERYILTKRRPSVYLERDTSGNWRFSARAVDEIIEWHREVFPWGMEKLLTLLPLLGKGRIGVLYLWQLMALLILIIVVVVLQGSFMAVGRGVVPRMLRKWPRLGVSEQLLRPTLRALSWTLVCLGLLIVVPLLQLPVEMAHYTMVSIRVMLPLCATLIAYRAVDILHAYAMKRVVRTPTKLDDQLVHLLRKVFKIFVVSTGMLFVLDNLSVPIIPLLTGLSIGGLAFALAAQDTLKNLFGSVTIFIDRPFQIGDWVTSGDIDGTIEEIGLRSTRIRTFRDSVIYVPNAKLVDTMVDNHGLRKYRRYYTQLHLSLNTSTDQVEAFIEGLKSMLQAHPHSHKTRHEIHLHSITKAGIIVMFYIFVESSNWSDELHACHELNIQILRLAEVLRIAFTYEANTSESQTYTHDAEMLRARPDPKEVRKLLGSFLETIPFNAKP